MKYLFIKFFRDIKKMWAQFISVFLMAMISVTIFSGMSSVWNGLEESSEKYFEDTNLADIWINAEDITDDDIKAISEITYIDKAESQLTFIANAESLGGNETDICITSLDTLDFEVINPLIIEGQQISIEEGIWVDQDYAEANSLKTGDTIYLTIGDNKVSIPIRGIVLDSEYIFYLTSSIDSVPDHVRHGYAYINESFLKTIISEIHDNQIRIKLKDNNITKDKITTDIKDILGSRFYSLSEREDMPSIWQVVDEQDQIRKMAILFSAIFILLSLLTMYTTMSRLVGNQIIQIGTMKALGYGKYSIYIHYAMYGFAVALLGGICGIGVGLTLVSNLVMNVKKATLTLPDWPKIPGTESIALLIIITAICTLASLITVHKVIKGVPAQTIRGIIDTTTGSCKKKKRSHISFEWIWTLRTIKTHPARYTMGVVAVIGSIVLMVAGTGMWDSLNYSYGSVYGEEYTYEYAATINTDMYDSLKAQLDNKDVQYVQNLSAVFSAKSAEYGGIITVLSDGELVNLYDYESGDKIKMSDNGVYITHKMAESLNAEVNDIITIKIDNSNTIRDEKIIAVIDAKLPQGIFMTDTAYGTEYYPDTIYLKNTSDTELARSEKLISGVISIDEQQENMNTLLESIHTIIYILFVAAFILSAVIIYNLGTLNYIERYREYATMKVLGFYKSEINAVVFRDCILSLTAGLIVGIPLSIVFLKAYVEIVASDNMEWTPYISTIHYIILVMIVIIFTLLINLMVCNKVRKVDMVEAMKSID